MNAGKISIVSGISMPYFPPRPTEGARITSEADLPKLDAVTYVIQGKMNGDRACALILDGKVHLQNRHGSWFKHPVDNQAVLLKLPDRTLLDGEVKNKTFYPFEAVVVGGESLMFKGPEVRVAEVQRLCTEAKIPYLFDPADTRKCAHWEGYVLKKRGSFYLPLGSEGQSTSTWWKRKWTDGSVVTP